MYYYLSYFCAAESAQRRDTEREREREANHLLFGVFFFLLASCRARRPTGQRRARQSRSGYVLCPLEISKDLCHGTIRTRGLFTLMKKKSKHVAKRTLMAWTALDVLRRTWKGSETRLAKQRAFPTQKEKKKKKEKKTYRSSSIISTVNALERRIIGPVPITLCAAGLPAVPVLLPTTNH